MSLIQNGKVRFNYVVKDKFEAGIELFGHEVKTIRMKHGSLDGSYIVVKGGEIFLHKAFIPPYQEKNTPKSYDPYRVRRLLLNKKEIAKLATMDIGKTRLTIVPISMYNKGAKIKLEIAIAQGKSSIDKRETIKKRETDREIRRSLKNYD